MQIYNPIKYKWERDPLGKYAYGATCVKDCPEHLLKDNGACVRACPPKKKVRKGVGEQEEQEQKECYRSRSKD